MFAIYQFDLSYHQVTSDVVCKEPTGAKMTIFSASATRRQLLAIYCKNAASFTEEGALRALWGGQVVAFQQPRLHKPLHPGTKIPVRTAIR